MRLRLQLRTFEPSPPKPAAWHTWAKHSAGDIPDFALKCRIERLLAKT
jgi:hypothetical protein